MVIYALVFCVTTSYGLSDCRVQPTFSFQNVAQCKAMAARMQATTGADPVTNPATGERSKARWLCVKKTTPEWEPVE
jgi:hypothetical protein